MRQFKNANMSAVIVVLTIALLNVLLLVTMQLSYLNVIVLFFTSFIICIKPEMLLLLFLVSTSTVTDCSQFPKITIAEVDIFFSDFLLLLSFVVMIINHNVKQYIRRLKNPMTYVLVIFIAFVIVAILQSAIEGDFRDLTQGIANARPLLYYLLFFPAIVMINNEEKLQWFIRALVVLIACASIYIILTALFGNTIVHKWLRITVLQRSLTSVDTGMDGTMLRSGRIRDIPGILFVATALPMIIGLLLYNWRSRSVKHYYAGLFLGVIAIVLTFTRMIWVSFLSIIIVMLFIIKGKGSRYVKISFTALSFLFIAFLALSVTPRYSHVELGSFVTKRFISFFSENINAGTAIQRIIESKAALEALEGKYIWGIGISKQIEASRVIYNNHVYYLHAITSLHNSYLNIILKIGVFPLILYLLMSFLFLKRSYVLFKKSKRSYTKGLSIGLFLCYFRVMINAVSQHYFWKISVTPVIAILFALNEILIALDSREEEPVYTSKDIVRKDSTIVSTIK